MHEFDYDKFGVELLTPDITSLVSAIHEAKGRQSLQIVVQPQSAYALVNVARIQSTAASNRIEGIATTDKRLNAIMHERVAPQGRQEEEIAGYRDVLATIHDNHDYIPLTANVVLQLHRDLFRHTPLSFGGHWKDTDNIIMETDGAGHSRVRFTPPPAIVTPELIESACRACNGALSSRQIDPLLVICMFVFDFTCIHPFNDGNGRMSRLLTLLLLYRNGYEIGKYVSIEHAIEQTKDAYYQALSASTVGWNEGKQDYAPFVKYLLEVILTAYQEFDERTQIFDLRGPNAGKRLTKGQRIDQLFADTLGPLSKADIVARLPDISVTTVERTLKKLLDDGKIIKLGKGRAVRYVGNKQ